MAFLDRFSCVYRMGYLPAERERAVLLSRAPQMEEELAGRLVRMAGQVRTAAANEEVLCTLSTRRLIELGRKYVQLGAMAPALEITVLGRLAGADRQTVYEICQRHLGPALEGGAA